MRESNVGVRNLIADHRPELLAQVFAGDPVIIPTITSDVPPGRHLAPVTTVADDVRRGSHA
ncbi:MAG: hypothetical protein ACE5GX_10975 [Thermoanaerobaculia bacterium]